MDESNQIRRARKLIENEGDSVLYHEVQWYYLREMHDWTDRAVRVLERKGKLVRWSKKTPNLVRLVEGDSK